MMSSSNDRDLEFISVTNFATTFSGSEAPYGFLLPLGSHGTWGRYFGKALLDCSKQSQSSGGTFGVVFLILKDPSPPCAKTSQG